jgi:zinc/manganese transport system substrate-binding protein
VPRPRRPRWRPAGAAVAVLLSVSACQTSAPASITSSGAPVISAVASISAWGSILDQLGGTRVRTTAIISRPNTDPHDYEPTPADARVIAAAALVVENGAGYDPWAARTVAANGAAGAGSGARVIDVARLVDTPTGGNPHQWYSPSDVARVVDAITGQLTAIDPSAASYFAARRRSFDDIGLGRYRRLIARIRATYAGVPIGASESIVAPLASALGLRLITPARFLEAVSEGSDPSAADKARIDTQIATRSMKVYVLNAQNATPDVAAQVAAARKHGIPVTPVTESLSPAGASFQDWQVAQLLALARALHAATGR